MSGRRSDVETSSDALVTTSHQFLAAIQEMSNFQLASVMLEDFNGLSENQAKKLLLSTQIEIKRLEGALDKCVTSCSHADPFIVISGPFALNFL